jgi:hypothetical protein
LGLPCAPCKISLASVATGSYYSFMKQSKRVGIKDLKNNLSAYLREVRNGAHIIVSDRDSIVAELHEPYRQNALDSGLDPILFEWTQSHIITLPAAPKMPLSTSPIKASKGIAIKLLEKDREERY